MTRKEFIKICGILGITTPVTFPLNSCSEDSLIDTTTADKVIIIGAGAGGLSAAYLLSQLGIDFELLEASAEYGGRMKINNSFTDFPIPLGAEWIETGTGIFTEIVNDSLVNPDIKTFSDKPDQKFHRYSWYQFFQDYIVPRILNKIRFNTVVKSIDSSTEKITVESADKRFEADKVIVSVPLKILKDGDILFKPELPKDKRNAIDAVQIWPGFKAFFEFSSKFYQDEHVFSIQPESDGEKLYYDAAYGQNSSRNILGLFVVGKPAASYLSRQGNNLRDYILSELDQLYSGQASTHYVKHITQNWNDEPFIRSAYLTDYADWKTVRLLGQPVANKIYFAAGEYTDGEDWVSVHAAARSAKMAVQAIAG